MLRRSAAPLAVLVSLALASCGEAVAPAAEAQTTPSAVMSRSLAPATPSAPQPPSRSGADRTLDAHQLAAMAHARTSVSDGEIMRQLANTAERIAQRYAAGGPNQPPAPADINPGTNRALGYALMIEFGWPASEWPALDALWHRESGWHHLAENRSSGAYGIPQSLPASKMAAVGPDWRTNPETQIRWGLAYIGARYGSPKRAWAHSEKVGWY
jgi:hypothetical protein